MPAPNGRKEATGKGPVSNVEAIKAVAIKAAAAKGAAAQVPPQPGPTRTPRPPTRPLLDLSDAAVRKMIKNAKKRGYVTYEQLNGVLPSEEVTSEQIEDVLAMLNEMGINVVESEEAGEAEEGEEDDDDDDAGGDLVEVSQKAVAETKKSEPGERTDDPVRMYLREMGSVELLVARGRDRDRQAHRGRPRGDDRGPVRKPAHLPGDHHLARRAERRKGVPARHHRPGGDLRRPRCRQGHGQPGDARAARRPCRAPARPDGRRRPARR